MKLEALTNLQASLDDGQMVGNKTKPQSIVIAGLLLLMHQIAHRNGWEVKEKNKRPDYSEFELPHVTLKFYEDGMAEAQFGRGVAQITDTVEYAQRLYSFWKFCEYYNNPPSYGKEQEDIVRALYVTKQYLTHLHPMVYVYAINGSPFGLMFQGTASCGHQFRAELSFW